MGKRQERKIRRALAEKEVKKALEDACKYINEHPAEFSPGFTLTTLRNLVEEKISEDTRFRFKDIIDYELKELYQKYREFEQKYFPEAR